MDLANDLLACPVCRSGLTVAGSSVRCVNGHSYDLARQGYLNLLGGPEPANADTAAMLGARARVHAAGIFEVVADRVAAQVGGRMSILEVGSGTAYYLSRALGQDPAAVGVALDVSRAAAKAAARTDPRIAAVVADVWRPLPVRDRCLDAILGPVTSQACATGMDCSKCRPTRPISSQLRRRSSSSCMTPGYCGDRLQCRRNSRPT